MRLLSILLRMQMRGRSSAEDLARELEVSVRTIYRDMDQLSAAGVPVVAERGRAGGFTLLDGYRTKLTGFTTAEAGALLLGGIGAAASDLGIGAEVRSAQLKLLASLPRGSGASAQRVAARFHFDPVAWYARAEAVDVLPALTAAVWGDRRIRARYESWEATATRELDPLGLVLKAGAWYLVAVAVASKGRREPRTYRVASLSDLEVLDVEARRPARFDLERYWAAASADFEARLLTGSATIRLSPEGTRLLREVSPPAARAFTSAHRPSGKEGWREAEVPIEGVAHTARQLLRLGGDVEVVRPAALREAVLEEARKIVARHARRRR